MVATIAFERILDVSVHRRQGFPVPQSALSHLPMQFGSLNMCCKLCPTVPACSLIVESDMAVGLGQARTRLGDPDKACQGGAHCYFFLMIELAL